MEFDKSIYDYIYVSPDAMSTAAEDEHQYTAEDRRKKTWLKIKPNMHKYLIWVAWSGVVVLITMRVIHFCSAIIYLDISKLNYNVLAMILSSFAPICLWIYSTHFEYWRMYIRRKLFSLTLALISVTLLFSQLIYVAVYYLIIPLVFKMPSTADITPRMIINLARGICAVSVLFPTICLLRSLFARIFNSKNRESILHYQVDRNWDLRKNKKFCYDATFVRRLDDGRMYAIKEKDRFLHILYDGTTGTAKTAGCINVSIVNDLNQKVRNEDFLKYKMHELLDTKDVIVKTPFKDDHFNMDYFEPTSKRGERLYNKYLENVRSCGITVLAPNGQLGDDVYKYATQRGFTVNRIDPTLDAQGRHKPGFIGFNPLYINPDMKGLERRIEINAKACLFADVLQAVYDSGSQGDPYFASVNRNVTTSVTILLELVFFGFHGRQPNPSDVQNVVNDFTRASVYLQALKNMPGHEDYQFVIDFVGYSLLGAGRQKMEEQASGLRMLMNDLLINPLYKSVLCSEESIDLDKALQNGEITIVNYATELGLAQAKAFGMFFAFSFNNAVLRRPRGKRIPHFYYIDEFPVLLHPNMEICFTYFRQFCVCTQAAIQSVEQMRKNPSTAYFESVLLGNTGHQVFFGRMSPVEMDFIEKLAGVEEDIVEQVSTNETAMSMKDTSMSFQKRLMPQMSNRLEGGDARYLDFMQVYLFTVDNGNAVPPFLGKVNFVPPAEKVKIHRPKYDWGYVPDNDPATAAHQSDNYLGHIKIADSPKNGNITIFDIAVAGEAEDTEKISSDADDEFIDA